MSEEHSDYGEKHTFSSGIPVLILPFPSLRFEKFIKQSKKKFVFPKPPKKKIRVVDGHEMVDNLKDKKYLDKKQLAETQQEKWLSEKILRVCLRDCIELDIALYEELIEILEKDNEEKYPENQYDRKVEFLIDYVIRSASDYQALTRISTQLMSVQDSEVSEQLDSFSSDVEGDGLNGT